jgi:DNA-binding transcriptional ArsR family regulator
VSRNTQAVPEGRSTEAMQRVKSEFFKALAHPARIHVLEILAGGERSVTELSEDVGIESSHMSQQLGLLRRAALIQPRKDGITVYYSLTDPRIAEILQLARQVLVTYMKDAAKQLEGRD